MNFPLRSLTLVLMLLNCTTAVLDAQQPQFAAGQVPRIGAVKTRPAPARHLTWPPPPPLPSGIPLPQAELDRLIADLACDSRSARSHAERRLLRGGPSAVAGLQKAILRERDIYLPIALPIVLPLLEQFVQHADEESAWAAADALSELTGSDKQPIRDAAAESLKNCRYPLRQRAIWRLQQSGAVVDFSRDFYDVDDRTGELYPLIANIIIDKSWKGGRKGLSLIERIPDLRMLYLVDGHPLTDDEVGGLMTHMVNLRIETRGRVQLGIQASLTPENLADVRGVRLTFVKPGSSAHEAGLRANDLITSIDGKRLESFPALVKALKKYSAGDVIKLSFVRPGREEIEIDVTLQAWNADR